jgi:hypothetical protein
MLNKIIILTIIISIKSVLSINSMDLCYSIDSLCKGKKSYECTKDICTLDRKKCNQYFEKLKELKTFRFLNYLALYPQKIKKCEYKLNKNDYCLKKIKCFQIRAIWNPFGFGQFHSIIKQNLDCKCGGLHPYECGPRCTLNEKYCNLIKTQNETNNIENKYCD